MKNCIIFLIIILSNGVCSQTSSGGGEAYPHLKTNAEALKKFQDSKFGMFIHWGPVALRGTEISWSRGVQVSIEDYDNLYKEFNPVLYNAKDWVTTAKNAGMKYIVLTTRHHDGFCLWDSQYTTYDMASTPYGKGIIKELSEECKKQGIDIGFYYTICDWRHEDYPVVYPDENYKFHEEKEITDPEVKQKMDNYVAYMENQLEELIVAYDPSFIWFDGEWEWAWTHEMGMDLYAYLRNLKEDILINNRVDKGREGMAGTTKSYKYAGDYATPEREIGKYDVANAWESCITIANQWAWKANDELKTRKQCIQTLVQTAGGGGNLLLNVGPMADGRIEKRQELRLKEIGDWLDLYGEAIYDTRGGPYLPNDYLVSTHKDNRIYLHLLKHPEGNINLPLPNGYKVRNAHFINQSNFLNLKTKKGYFEVVLPQELPNADVSVIVLEMNKSTSDMKSVKGDLN